jgi:hypothetical protein
MNLHLDPVWPWDWVWQIVRAVPSGVGFLTLVAAVALGVMAALWQAGRLSRRTVQIAGLVLAAVFLLFARHAYEPVAQSLQDLVILRGRLVLGWVVLAFALLLAYPLLAGLAAGSYLQAPVSARRRFIVLLLRLLAFLLALIALARPALGWSERRETRSLLLVGIDASRSMQVVDEEGDRSRWRAVLEQLEAAQPTLQRLREQGTDVQLVRFHDRVQPWDATREADGSHTDYGSSLREMFEARDPSLSPRALLIVGDGTDLGRTALAEAGRWRALPCPLLTFSVGKEKTSIRQNDVALTSITTAPQPTVPMKAPLSVRVTADAQGFENQPIQTRVFLEDKATGGEREVLRREERLPLSTGNEVNLTFEAPAEPGEYRLRVEMKPPEPDALPTNNSIETFVQVSREGLRVLLVDRPRFEPAFVVDALRGAGVQVTPIWVRGTAAPGQKDLLQLDAPLPHDVILLGDVRADQLRQLDPEALPKLARLVARGSGLLLYGGYNSFGLDWKGTPLEPMLPIELTEPAQEEEAVRVVPTDDGLRLAREVFALDGTAGPAGSERALWEKLEKLPGHSRLKLPAKPQDTDRELARTSKNQPLLIARTVAGPKGGTTARVAVFGADTTHNWVRDEESKRRFERFWRQLVVWLSQQKEAEGGVWVRPEAPARRLAAGSDLVFALGLKGKGGVDLPGTFEASVTDPGGAVTRVALTQSEGETRGLFAATRTPGIYQITVQGKGKDESGNLIQGTATARVMVYTEDREALRVAANPEFLKQLAQEGGGESFRLEALVEVLERLGGDRSRTDVTRLRSLPDWKTTERSGFLAAFLVAFCAVASLEWALRRLWGMA